MEDRNLTLGNANVRSELSCDGISQHFQQSFSIFHFFPPLSLPSESQSNWHKQTLGGRVGAPAGLNLLENSYGT